MTDIIKTKLSIYKYACSLWLLLHPKLLEWRLCLTLTQFSLFITLTHSTLLYSHVPWEIGPLDFLLSKAKKSLVLWGPFFMILLSGRKKAFQFLIFFCVDIRVWNNKRGNTFWQNCNHNFNIDFCFYIILTGMLNPLILKELHQTAMTHLVLLFCKLLTVINLFL